MQRKLPILAGKICFILQMPKINISLLFLCSVIITFCLVKNIQMDPCNHKQVMTRGKIKNRVHVRVAFDLGLG